MALGPGKYDHLATQVRQSARAKTVIVMVIDGDHGSGFSVQSVSRDIQRELPEMLRHMADQIEESQP